MEMHGRGELARFLTEKTKGRQMMFLNAEHTRVYPEEKEIPLLKTYRKGKREHVMREDETLTYQYISVLTDWLLSLPSDSHSLRSVAA